MFSSSFSKCLTNFIPCFNQEKMNVRFPSSQEGLQKVSRIVFCCELKTTVLNWFSILPSNPARI